MQTFPYDEGKEKELKKRRKWWRWAGKAAGAVLSAAVLAGLYFTLVIAQPQGEGRKSAKTQAPWEGAAPERISGEEELRELVQGFPGPVMSFMSSSGMVFVSGEAADAAFETGLGRILTLYWQTPEGQPMILQSIYPAEGLDLMGKGKYRFSAAEGPTLFGLPSVRMEDGENLRIHVQAEGTGLYVLTLPKTLAGVLGEICRSIQLFTAES